MELNLEKIVDESFNEVVNNFENSLKKWSEENKDKNISDYLPSLLIEITTFNKNFTVKTLENYHKELMKYVNSLNHQ